MTGEFEDEFPEEPKDHNAPEPTAAPIASVGSGLRSLDRRIVPGIIALALAGFIGLIWVTNASHHSDSRAAFASSIPITKDNSSFRAPDPTPTPVPRIPIVAPSVRSVLAMDSAPPAPPPAPASGGGGSAPQQAAPRTPTPEEMFAQEERIRVLEARRAPTKVQIDTGTDSAGSGVPAGAAEPNAQAPGAGTYGPGSPSGQTTAYNANGAMASAGGQQMAPHSQFLGQQNTLVGYVPATSEFELTRGTIIQCRLVTSVDSTLPGGVIVARVVSAVKDSRNHSVTVLPIGTILTGEGDSQTVTGEARYLSVFDRIEMPAPDSRKFFMGANNVTGLQGENGMSVAVDTHVGREFGHAFMYSLLQAGINLASRATTSVNVDNSNLVQSPSGAHLTPTFHKYAGEAITIIVSQDLPLDKFQEHGP